MTIKVVRNKSRCIKRLSDKSRFMKQKIINKKANWVSYTLCI